MIPPDLPVTDLTELAKEAMLARDLLPDFPSKVLDEAASLSEPSFTDLHLPDLRDKLWFSLDNEDTKDLDQITYAESTILNMAYIYIAIADVAILVKKDSEIDRFAQYNTTSVYTPPKVFSMLPERLSTDLTSLTENQDRFAIVIQALITQNGSMKSYQIYPALVRNQAKLNYHAVDAWLDDKNSAPSKITQVPGLAEQVKLQDQIARQIRAYRHEQGALTLDVKEFDAKIDQNRIVEVKVNQTRARDLIEDFMIAANEAVARFLHDHNSPSIRRVVRKPKRWDRIIDLAKQCGDTLPVEPDAKALDLFLIKRRLQDPLHFPDLSLAIVKLLGRGEYVLQDPTETTMGHFSLALQNYTHSTAPNRRLADLINQRLLKTVFNQQNLPYSLSELQNLAKRCTDKEDDAVKVERKMKKAAAAVLLSSKIDQVFDAIVTGASYKGTWVRIFDPPIEGKLIQGFENVDVGDRIKVKLVSVDLEKGFIDFVRTRS